VKIGVAAAFTKAHSREDIVGIARVTEGAGVHSLWVPEHVVFFPQHASRYPYSEDGRIPGNPDGILDPFSALCYLAACTEKIRLGTGICLVPQRPPLYTARQVADVDILSGGRFDFGVGVGWLAEEFAALGVPFARRGARTLEYLRAMIRIWTEDPASFDGEFVTFSDCLANPKPVQTPHPPIFIGGESEAALRRVAQVGNGWYGYNLTPAGAAERLARLDALLAEANRPRGDVQVFVGAPPGCATPAAVSEFADLGVAQLIFGGGGRNAESAARRLDRLGALL